MKSIQYFLTVSVFLVFIQCSKNKATLNGSAIQSEIIVASDSYDENRPANLYVVKPDGTGLCYLTHDGNLNRNAGWSYDGTKIVYFTGNLPGIWTMDAN